MKTLLTVLCLSAVFASCDCRTKRGDCERDKAPKPEVVLKDHGNAPAVLDIEAYTTANEDFRTTLWTGDKLQVTLMSIPEGSDIGLELHPETDQFLRIEEGSGKVMMGDSPDSLDYVVEVGPDQAVFVPAGKWHNLVNTGVIQLKLYSIYAPAEHPLGTVHKTQQDSMEAEHHAQPSEQK